MTNNNIKELARAQARELLARSSSFHGMNREEQLTLYKDLVNATYNKLAEQEGLSTQLASKKPEKASDLIDDERHYNKRIEQAGDLAGDFVDSVDFPTFVKDLLKGVFDANLEVTVTQMEEYIKLMKAATASISQFVKAIDQTAAFGYLAENKPDEFGLDFSDEDKDDDGNPKAILTNKSGEPMDIGDNTVKAKIMEAKIAMAKEQRGLLREAIMMGITRLVVKEGKVNAGVLFDIKASEKIDKKDKAAMKKSVARSRIKQSRGGLLGGLIGGRSGGTSTSSRKTQISVSSAKSTAKTELAAKLSGSVEINFITDYFKLDNFASLYAPVKGEEEVRKEAKT